MEVVKKAVVIVLCLLLIPVTAVATAAVKQRFADGPNRVFSGGQLVSGELHTGPEPDWSFVSDIETIELQLVDPPRSRRIWTAEHDGKLYVWSGYMGTAVGRVWKRWPVQAEQDGRAIIRIDGKRYERELVRITSGDILDGICEAIRAKYPSQTTRAAVEAGDAWVFEAAPRSSRRRKPFALMKYFYVFIAVSLVVTVVAVLFVPGVDDMVEQTFQRYVGRAAR